MTPTSSGFKISNWKEITKNTLRAWFTLELPSGILLHGWSYHATQESRWIAPPAKEYPAGKWTPILEIPDEGKRTKFQEQTLRAVDEFLEARK